ncbi:MAG: sugar transferase, partial [Gammaproteobacteria bacterium]|nr:sugar transferase [Gammaproteobacteria bacterium]
MKRVFDILLALLLLPFFLIPMIIVGILVKVTSKVSVLYWSDRVGKNNVIYSMPKFRSMRVDTPDV